MPEVPAELVIEKPDEGNGWTWVWAVCQPDACWGEWDAGRAPTAEEASRRGQQALRSVHRRQGLNLGTSLF